MTGIWLFIAAWMIVGVWLVWTGRAGYDIVGTPPWYVWPMIWASTLLLVPALYAFTMITGKDVR